MILDVTTVDNALAEPLKGARTYDDISYESIQQLHDQLNDDRISITSRMHLGSVFLEDLVKNQLAYQTKFFIEFRLFPLTFMALRLLFGLLGPTKGEKSNEDEKLPDDQIEKLKLALKSFLHEFMRNAETLTTKKPEWKRLENVQTIAVLDFFFDSLANRWIDLPNHNSKACRKFLGLTNVEEGQGIWKEFAQAWKSDALGTPIQEPPLDIESEKFKKKLETFCLVGFYPHTYPPVYLLSQFESLVDALDEETADFAKYAKVAQDYAKDMVKSFWTYIRQLFENGSTISLKYAIFRKVLLVFAKNVRNLQRFELALMKKGDIKHFLSSCFKYFEENMDKRNMKEAETLFKLYSHKLRN